MHIHKLKVGVLLENYKKEEGGAHSYYNTLIEGIANYNFDKELEFVFVNIGQSIDPSAPEKSYSFDIEQIVKNKHPFFSFFNSLSNIKGINNFSLSRQIQFSFQKRYNQVIRQKLVENEIDLIYSLTPFYKDFNYPTVTTHWDIGHKSMFSFPEVTYNGEHEFRELFYKNYLQKAFAIVCESEAGKNELSFYKNVNPDKIFVVPMFPGDMIKLQVEQSEVEQILNKFALHKNEFFIYPAQFWAHKNHFNLIIAFNDFVKTHLNAKLVLSGSDKGNLQYIKALVKQLNLEDNVIFAGFVTNEELNTFYKNAIALVMPTFLGPTNMPLLEAQALGCKVICSDFTGHRESLGNEAIFIDPNNHGEILQAMEELYKKRDINLAPVLNKTLYASLKEINQTFKKLSTIRKTFPLNFEFKCLLGILFYSLERIGMFSNLNLIT